jgi:peptide deformylase
MAIQPILKLGDPGLWKNCQAVKDVQAPEIADVIRDLKDTLDDFKNRNGFGRGIAAPQIGALERILFIDFPQEKISRLMINPRIVWQGEAKIRLWDDCFSFPDLLVKVERAREVQVEYLSVDGESCSVAARGELAELLQHEIDHLDGILAVERAIDGKSFACRSEWQKHWKGR